MFIEVTLMINGKPQGSFINKVDELHEIDMEALFESSDYTYQLKRVEMTEEEYNELPEFVGF